MILNNLKSINKTKTEMIIKISLIEKYQHKWKFKVNPNKQIIKKNSFKINFLKNSLKNL